MPEIKINTENKELIITCPLGASIKEALISADIPIRTGCDGSGACGLCRIIVLSGQVNKHSVSELIYLNSELRGQGIRLACQTIVKEDISIRIIAKGPKTYWKRLFDNERNDLSYKTPGCPVKAGIGPSVPIYGAAIDIGTTNIRITVLDLLTGERLCGRQGINPGIYTGSDILTRIQKACESEKNARQLQDHIVYAIADAFWTIQTKDNVPLQNINKVVIAGNTAMLTLLSGRNYHKLLDPKAWTEYIDCGPFGNFEWAFQWGLNPDAEILFISPLRGYIGSDISAGILATGLHKDVNPAMLIDFGTNTEVVLWDTKTLWITSAAGGPAFEGCGIGCGMPAESGAIYSINLTETSIKYKVIGNSKPLGICGSGMIDLVADMLKAEMINSKGQFIAEDQKQSFDVIRDRIKITKADIDILQRAKSAVSTCIRVLTDHAPIGIKDIKKIYIAGTFGEYLNISNAQKIGLLPLLDSDVFIFAGNTALAGSEAALFLKSIKNEIDFIKSKVQIINMAFFHDFNNVFFENLFLKPYLSEV